MSLCRSRALGCAVVVVGWAMAPACARGAEHAGAVALYLEAVGGQVAADDDAGAVQRKLVLLRAAARVDPHVQEVYEHLAATSLEIGRTDVAEWAMRSFLGNAGRHALMRLQLIGLELNGLETVEAKRDRLEQTLADDPGLVAEVRSDAYRQLAGLAWQGYDAGRARRFLEQALEATEHNLKAQQMLTELVLADEKSHVEQRLDSRVRGLLAAVSANPLNEQAYTELAVLAGRAGLAVEFEFWLEARRRLLLHLKEPDGFGPQERLTLAESALAAGLAMVARDLAIPLIESATTGPTTRPEGPGTSVSPAVQAQARVVLAVASHGLGDETGLAEQEAWFKGVYADLLSNKQVSPAVAAVAGVYAAVHGQTFDNPTLAALRLGNYACKAGGSRDNLAVLASALAHGRAAESKRAYELLDGLTDGRVPLAVLARVWAQLAENKPGPATTTLRRVLREVGPGPIRDRLVAIWQDISKKSAPRPDFSGVSRRLEGWDRGVLLVPYRPGDSCGVRVRAVGDLGAGDFVRLHVTLTNVGRVPVVLGPASLVDPQATVEVRVTGSQPERFTIPVSLNGRQILGPGERVVGWAFLDQARSQAGVAWRDYLAGVERIDGIAVRAVIGSTISGPAGGTMALVSSDAAAVKVGGGKHQTLAGLRDDLARPGGVTWGWANRAVRLMTHAGMARQADALTDAMVRAIGERTSDEATVVAYVLRYAKRSGLVLNALAGKLNDRSWLCRLVALDSVGRLEGPAAEALYQHYAQRDRDAMVRQLATAYILTKK